MQLNQDFSEFIELLNAKQVEYMIVGGYAVGFHGYPRYTGDIDVWIGVSSQNAEKIIQVLKEFGFSNLNITTQDFLKEDLIVQLGYEPVRIDILTSVTGLQFSECFKHCINADFEGLKVNFLDLENLKKNKLATGRQKDLGDIENLPK